MRRAILLAGLLLLGACDDMATQPRQKGYSPDVGPVPEPFGAIEFLDKPVPAPPIGG